MGSQETPKTKEDSDEIRKQVGNQLETMLHAENEGQADPEWVRRMNTILDQLPDRVVGDLAKRFSVEKLTRRDRVKEFVERYEISAAELKLLQNLSDGKTVAEHAEETGISINTARTHARRLLEKTDSRNQVDLIRKFLT